MTTNPLLIVRVQGTQEQMGAAHARAVRDLPGASEAASYL